MVHRKGPTMKAVDVLIQARNLLSDKNRWTKNYMKTVRNGKECFCAAGAVCHEAGVLEGEKTYTNFTGNVFMNVMCGIVPVTAASNSAIREAEALGEHARAAHTALKYLRAASGHDSFIYVNDVKGYDAVMKMFDVAIRNAKRRHINGDRKKPTISELGLAQ